MQKQKENLFSEKFSLLHSQENSEDIKWSSSSSSDYENTSYNSKLCNKTKTLSRKRKRTKKAPKNISNLDITIVDSSGDHRRDSCREKSPILVPKCVETPASPILTSSRFPPNSSPILSMAKKSFHQKSPILISKNASPKHTNKVRKKLAYNDQKTLREQNSFKNTGNALDLNKKTPDTGKNHASKVQDNIVIKTESNNNCSIEDCNADDKLIIINSTKSDESGSSLKAKLKLTNNVKSYFDSHYSSENTSQNISDTPTPEECLKNETIDILTCKTQSFTTIKNLSKQDSICTSNSDTSNYFQKNKKIKYKKGGIAYRLNMLLKKQNASVSLWQHERFLAGNSNFVIPKGEHVVFFIKKVDFKYGCYLLDAIDVNNEKYVIFMNSLYVNNNVSAESVLKLYEPYKTLECEDRDYKIIINVCKFECFDLNNR
ncbi:hypothetical protein PYW07_013346 [Mythimna separata]|uniref:Uncharacterized protein n=1 Tax=Mythimna separata TaxID=271217 RepID=A0AAD7Y6I2_MYTSE|nr:hypothetical protein PYW07_013346 [Mythimna separata]